LFGGQTVIGCLMIALTVVIHTAGLIVAIKGLKARGIAAVETSKLSRVMLVLVLIIIGIFLLHTIEIWCWAALYLWLGEFDTMARALYFSTVTFTTLGYGDITLGERWQLLSSFEAVNGVILFGVSTAFVFAVLHRVFEAASIIEPER
jgi:hypothetical protein